jgi:hypothetical protein
MRVHVNGVRLFFDVEGASLVPDGPTMRESHRCCSCTAAQVLITQFTSRPTQAWLTAPKSSTWTTGGNGRSDAGPKESWTLAQWGDDVRSFCDVHGIERRFFAQPGAVSRHTGQLPAMALALRVPSRCKPLPLLKGGQHDLSSRRWSNVWSCALCIENGWWLDAGLGRCVCFCTSRARRQDHGE